MSPILGQLIRFIICYLFDKFSNLFVGLLLKGSCEVQHKVPHCYCSQASFLDVETRADFVTIAKLTH